MMYGVKIQLAASNIDFFDAFTSTVFNTLQSHRTHLDKTAEEKTTTTTKEIKFFRALAVIKAHFSLLFSSAKENSANTLVAPSKISVYSRRSHKNNKQLAKLN